MRQSGILAARRRCTRLIITWNVWLKITDGQKCWPKGLRQWWLRDHFLETNMVYFKHPNAQTVLDKAAQKGVRALTAKANTVLARNAPQRER